MEKWKYKSPSKSIIHLNNLIIMDSYIKFFKSQGVVSIYSNNNKGLRKNQVIFDLSLGFLTNVSNLLPDKSLNYIYSISFQQRLKALVIKLIFALIRFPGK